MNSVTEWISAVSNGVLALGTIGLVCYAGRSFEEWQRQRRADWWNSTAKDILVKGNAVHRICSSIMAQGTGEVESRYWRHLRGEAHIHNSSAESLLAELHTRFHELLGALYIGEFTWGEEIESHYEEIHNAMNNFHSEVERLRNLASAEYEEVEQDIHDVAVMQHANPGRTSDVVTNVGVAMRSLSKTLRSKTYGTRGVEEY